MNNFCQECGSPRDENAKFCPNCGFKFHQEAKEEIEPTKEVEAPKEIKETKDTLEIPQYENLTSQETQAPKIGGWLYLIAFGLILGALASIVFPLLFVLDENKIAEVLTTHPRDLSFIKIYISLTFLSFFSLFLFFSKDKNTRIFMLICCILGAIDSIAFDRGRGLLGCTVWFLYFMFSKRVKETFVIHHSWKNLVVKALIASIPPLFFIILFNVNYPTEQKISQTRNRNYANLERFRLAIDNKEILLKGLAQQKSVIIQDEIKTLSSVYSLNDDFNSELELIKHIDQTQKYKNLAKGLLYFCGNQCSPIGQNFRKSYDYLNNIDGKEREEITLMLAEMDLYGIGTRQSISSAVKNASLATNLNNYGKSMKYYYYGLGYLYGEYYTKNIDQAIEYFKRSADLGNPASAFLSALLMATESKKNHNHQTIVKYFTRAISLGNSDANLPLAFYYYSIDELSLAEQTLQQCSKTNPECKTAYQKLFE